MTPRSRQHRRHATRGAILVELAFVLPVLMLIVTGMLEMGVAWRHKVSADQAVRQGARVSSHLSSSTDQADYEAMQAMRASLAGEWNNVEYVVVYRADADGAIPMEACHTTSQPGLCNRWSLTELNAGLADNDASMWSSAPWSAPSRNNSIDSPDHIGVFVKLEFDWQTGMFPGDGPVVTSTAVMRVEPEIG